jgi:hypothetical protein
VTISHSTTPKLHRQVAGPRTFQDLDHVICCAARILRQVNPVADETTVIDMLAEPVYGRLAISAGGSDAALTSNAASRSVAQLRTTWLMRVRVRRPIDGVQRDGKAGARERGDRSAAVAVKVFGNENAVAH